jgi:hypothetical protein
MLRVGLGAHQREDQAGRRDGDAAVQEVHALPRAGQQGLRCPWQPVAATAALSLIWTGAATARRAVRNHAEEADRGILPRAQRTAIARSHARARAPTRTLSHSLGLARCMLPRVVRLSNESAASPLFPERLAARDTVPVRCLLPTVACARWGSCRLHAAAAVMRSGRGGSACTAAVQHV